MYFPLRSWIREHTALLTALVLTLVFACLPIVEIWILTGDGLRSVSQLYGDMLIYGSHMREVATGNLFFGNPYFLEHRFDPPLALFGSSVLAALPMLLGVPLFVTLIGNFIVWSVVFVVLFYWLFREFDVPEWVSAGGALFAYVQSYDMVERPSVAQEVFPFFLLFYIFLVRFLKNPNLRKNSIWLGVFTGVSFYIYGYLWQIVVVTLGFLALYALVWKRWQLFKSALIASVLGGVIGAPPFLYSLWVTRQPYFWESMDRWGLVRTHIPMAEVVYSGGWIALILLLLFVLYKQAPQLKKEPELFTLFLFLSVTGLGLWATEGSNLITGQLLELGEHLRRFIAPWFALATVLSGFVVWRHFAGFGKGLRVFLIGMGCMLVFTNLSIAYEVLSAVAPTKSQQALVLSEQQYAKPLAWLENHEKAPVVVWGDPHDDAISYVPALTKHYVLYEEFGQFNLLSNDEFYERYLVSQYFNNPSAAQLQQDLDLYVGRAKAFHYPMTLTRGIKICKILHFYNGGKNCGTVLSATELLGQPFFDSLEQKFQTDIKPNIMQYLKKYHVRYILKDVVLDPLYHPEALGAVRVYADDRFELYRLP